MVEESPAAAYGGHDWGGPHDWLRGAWRMDKFAHLRALMFSEIQTRWDWIVPGTAGAGVAAVAVVVLVLTHCWL